MFTLVTRALTLLIDAICGKDDGSLDGYRSTTSPCTCDFTWEEVDAAGSPWHRAGCPQGR